mgnify:CR=1 FL=1
MTSTAIAGARMLSVGTALPDKVLTNHDLEEMVDTSHQWIVERSGIHERRIGRTTAGLAAEAAQMAIERSGVDPTSIDLLILATTSPDRQVPATASTVQEILGLRRQQHERFSDDPRYWTFHHHSTYPRRELEYGEK